MILPAARWYRVGLLLALVAPVAFWWPGAGTTLIAADIVWLALLGIDMLRAARRLRDGIAVQRTAPPAFSVGRSLPVIYEWVNHTAGPIILRVRETLPPQLQRAGASERTLVIPAHETLRDDQSILPVARGRAAEGAVHLRARGPWGLAWAQERRDLPWDAVVYPSLRNAAVRALATQAQRRREAGLRNQRRRGEGRLFESLKEWVPGEDPRTIDWKATARAGKWIARHYEDERRQHVMIVVDAGRMLTAEVDGRARLESAIDAALDLAHGAVRHDDNVGLLVFADEILHYVAPARGQRALRQIIEALALTTGRLVEPDYPAAFAFLAARQRKRALTVVLTDVIDRTASDALMAQAGSLRPRHLPLVVTLRDPALERVTTAHAATEGDAYRQAAAEELLDAREAALADLRSRGVLVQDVAPADAAWAVVSRYEVLKRRGQV